SLAGFPRAFAFPSARVQNCTDAYIRETLGRRKHFFVPCEHFFVPHSQALCYRVLIGRDDMARKRKGATPHLRIRIEPQLLTRLEKSRTANNRTLTGEIVHRIEQTFRKSDDADLATLVFRAAFGEHTGDLLRAFATAIWLIERRTGKKWHEDRETA